VNFAVRHERIKLALQLLDLFLDGNDVVELVCR